MKRFPFCETYSYVLLLEIDEFQIKQISQQQPDAKVSKQLTSSLSAAPLNLQVITYFLPNFYVLQPVSARSPAIQSSTLDFILKFASFETIEQIDSSTAPCYPFQL